MNPEKELNLYLDSMLKDIFRFAEIQTRIHNTKNKQSEKKLLREELECCSSIKTNVNDIDMEILTLERKINESLDNKDKGSFMKLTEQLNLLLEIKESQKLSALVF